MPSFIFTSAVGIQALDKITGAFQLMLQNSSLLLLPSQSAPPRRSSQRSSIHEKLPEEKIKSRSRVSAETDAVTLFLMVKIKNLQFFQHPKMKPFFGIQNLSSTAKHIIKDLEIISWDGKQKPKAPYTAKDTSSDVVIARNENTTSGQVITQIKEGKLEYGKTFPWLIQAKPALHRRPPRHSIR